MLDVICQIMIPLTGVPALYLLVKKPARPKLAVILGVVGQPFWYITAWHAHQWGIFAINLCYSTNWLYGVWQHWIKPWRERRSP